MWQNLEIKKLTAENYLLLSEKLNYVFKNKQLLQQALTRKSIFNEPDGKNHVSHNEKLEFLGDSILRCIVDDFLVEKFPEYNEDRLSETRDQLVSKNGELFNIAENLGLEEFIILSKGERKALKGLGRKKILTDTFEAIIAAIFIDSDKDHDCIKLFIGEQFKFEMQLYKDRGLFNAIKGRNLNKIKFWLDKGANPSAKLEVEITPPDIMRRIEEYQDGSMGFFPQVDYFLHPEMMKISAVRLALYDMNDHTGFIIHSLLMSGAKLNEFEHEYQHIPLLQLIIANLGRVKFFQRTLAFANENVLLKLDVDYLLSFGPYYSAYLRDINGRLRTIVESSDFDERRNHSHKILNDILLWLCECGAEVNLRFINDTESTNIKDGIAVQYFTPLCLAVILEDQEKVKILLEYKANPNLRSYKGKLPLHQMARLDNDQLDDVGRKKLLSMFDLLLQYGADLKLICDGKNVIMLSKTKHLTEDGQAEFIYKDQCVQTEFQKILEESLQKIEVENVNVLQKQNLKFYSLWNMYTAFISTMAYVFQFIKIKSKINPSEERSKKETSFSQENVHERIPQTMLLQYTTQHTACYSENLTENMKIVPENKNQMRNLSYPVCKRS